MRKTLSNKKLLKLAKRQLKRDREVMTQQAQNGLYVDTYGLTQGVKSIDSTLRNLKKER